MKLFGWEVRRYNHIEEHWLPIVLKKSQRMQSGIAALEKRLYALESQVDALNNTLFTFLKSL